MKHGKPELTPARAAFLSLASRPEGASAWDGYPPAKWGVANGYIDAKPQSFGGHRYHLTALGRATYPEVCR